MIKINDYENKVTGCFLGKCIGGNIGAPYEGMKQRMDLKYSPSYMENMLPNDDLDLQVLWLDVLESKGINATAADYATAFNENCDYAPGEYAFFKKNYRKGIMPPLSGSFNNEYFNNGMGAPIRSELWACLYPGDPEAAVARAETDACVDHPAGSDSVYGEMFLAALESLCFCGGSMAELIETALKFVPQNGRLHRAVSDVLAYRRKGLDINGIMDRIIRDYGHSESAMVHQNICIIAAALTCCEHSFTDAVMAAVNCGFDTDCTGATVGAVMGILLGGDRVSDICGVKDAGYKLGIRSPRTDHSVGALADSVCRMRERIKEDSGGSGYCVTQIGSPAIGFGEKREIVLKIRSPRKLSNALLKFDIASPVKLDTYEFALNFRAGEEKTVKIAACVDGAAKILPEALPGTVRLDGEIIGRFGLSGKRRWRVYGPYWKNNIVIPPLGEGESYWKYIPGEGDDFMDSLRFFHIASLPDESGAAEAVNGCGCKSDFITADTAEDIVRLSDCTGFDGNSAYMFSTDFLVEDDCTLGLQIGRNTPIKVWLNGENIATRDGNEMFYHESIHKLSVKLHNGVNNLSFMIVKNSGDTKFSYQFLSNGVCSDHVMFSTVKDKEEI